MSFASPDAPDSHGFMLWVPFFSIQIGNEDGTFCGDRLESLIGCDGWDPKTTSVIIGISTWLDETARRCNISEVIPRAQPKREREKERREAFTRFTIFSRMEKSNSSPFDMRC